VAPGFVDIVAHDDQAVVDHDHVHKHCAGEHMRGIAQRNGPT
jgi:N-acyl-D-aspartate/D-glutamate deacylase